MEKHGTIVWFRQDLRLEDNLALAAALERGGPIIPVYIWAPEEEGRWPLGGAARWWLNASLQALDQHLQKIGSRLIIRTGHSLHCIKELIQETQAKAIYWNRRYEPDILSRDTLIKAHLRQIGMIPESYNSALLFEPWEIKTKQASPFQVFSPFWKTCQSAPAPRPPFSAPSFLPPIPPSIGSIGIEKLELEPKVNWAEGLRANWQPGEQGAMQLFNLFVTDHLQHYLPLRDRPDMIAVSRLSPHIHFGEISPRTLWHGIKQTIADSEQADPHDHLQRQKSGEGFLRQLGWREFAHHLLFHFPHTVEEPLRPAYKAFPWKNDPKGLEAWQKGQTGFPIVDAGMRELWATGWMHNRVRLIVASFLVKDLLIPWQHGTKWFWDTLVDADLANNSLNWQWTAGCGADAAPYFRIFNPVIQSEKFDPKGEYIRKWVPELSKISNKYVHKPWEASFIELKNAGITLGKSYPYPIVDHAEARDRALKAFAYLKP